jgi:hypothetical protein
MQKGQTRRAVRAAVDLLAERGIFPHSLEKFNSGFHRHPLSGIFGKEVKIL